MKLKLAHKLFFSNLAILLMLVVVMLSVSYVSGKNNLDDFLLMMEGKRLNELANTVAHLYQKQGSWEKLTRSDSLWSTTLRSSLRGPQPAMPPARDPRTPMNRDNNQPPPPPPGAPFFSPPPIDAFGNMIQPDMPPMEATAEFINRLSLMDADKNVLINAQSPQEERLLKEITVNGKVVGWLSLELLDRGSNPVAAHFLHRQLTQIYWVAAVGILLAAISSLLLSRHITSPIKKLSLAATEIAKRNFDIHIRVNTRDELRDLALHFNQIASALRSYEERQKQWVMDISHELRTPLTILQGEIEAISDGVSQCDESTIASLREEVLQMGRLVQDIHELCITDTLEFACLADELDLQQLVTNELRKYHDRLSSKGIHLTSDLGSSELIIKGDASRLSQVIKNLLENSLRYTETPGSLWVKSERADHCVVLRFEDSGPGVPDEALEKLFDRLYRTESSRNRKTGGAGLGLAISKNIIDAHGGTIAASRSQKGGLCITIKLPIS